MCVITYPADRDMLYGGPTGYVSAAAINAIFTVLGLVVGAEQVGELAN